MSVSGRTIEDYEQGRYSMPPDRWMLLQGYLSVILSDSEMRHQRTYPGRRQSPRNTKLAQIVEKHFGSPQPETASWIERR